MKIKQKSLTWAGLALLATQFIACNSNDEPQLPPIGGFNSADEVAAANLVAYWGFNGDGRESKSNVAPDQSTNATYTAGVKGQAVSLAEGFLRYPTIPALNTPNGLASFTVSAWVNLRNVEGKATSIFALNEARNAAPDWGQLINLMAETGSYRPSSDTLVVKGLLGQYSTGLRRGHDNLNNFGVAGTDFQIVRGAGKWTQVAMKYDASTSTIDVYANGVLVSNRNFRVRDGGQLGPLVFPTGTTVLFGAFANQATGYPQSAVQSWQALFNGQIDEVRVYNRPLSDGDLSALYQLESAGR
ncbi:MAG: LamG-like jellyroll fold domain-containing protein [Spirosomataceae bacterium]|jgi:hypothetical protein